MKNILIDISYITSEQKSKESVAIYAFRFLDSIKKDNGYKIDLLVSEEMISVIKSRYPQYDIITYPSIIQWIKSIPYLKGIIKTVKWKNFINKLDYDVIYIPFSWSGNSLKTKIPKVVTIHDLRPMRSTERAFTSSIWFKALGLKHIYLKCSKFFYTCHCKNANKIIGISDYIAQDIKNEWPEYAKKVQTIYNGVTLPTELDIPIETLVGVPYILYVNTLAKYKNIITLIRAFAIIKDKYPTLKLVVVGKSTDYWTNTVVPEINDKCIADRICHIKYLSDEQLIWAYKNANIFITPSIHEGFGYTPIEAAICGATVISSRCDSLPDVTANKVTYFDPPTSEENLSEKIESLLDWPKTKNELQEISSFFKERYDQAHQSNKILECVLSSCKSN